MKPLRIGVAQTDWPGDRTPMLETYRQLAEDAARQGVELLCLQEFTISPYFASTTDKTGFGWSEPLYDGPTDQFISELARTHNLKIVGSLFEQTADGEYRDTATLHDEQGELIAFTRKVHIPSGTGYHEDHFFEGDDQFPVHDIGQVNLSIPTCYDQWFPEMSRICALNGAEMIYYPSAIGSEPESPGFDSQPMWEAVMRGQAVANGLFIAASNRTGKEGVVAFYGSSFICDPKGKILARASRDQTELIVADLDPAVLEETRRLFPLLTQRRPAVYGRLTEE